MDCKTSHLPLAKHLEAMVRAEGKLNGLPIVAVTGHTEQAISCDTGKPRTFETLMLASIGLDGCGKPAIRVKFIDSCSPRTNCSNNSDANLLNSIFAYDSSTKTYALVLNQST